MNFVTEYVKYAAETTDAPVEFHTFAAYMLASACAHNLYFPYGPHKVHLNLYTLLLAGSSTLRKSTVLQIAKTLAIRAGAPMLPNEITQEAFVERLAKQRIGTMWLGEFQTMQKSFSRDYMAGFPAFLCDVYDSPEIYTRTLRSNEYTMREPVVSIAAASTLELFEDLAKSGEIRSGLYPRFLFCIAKKKRESMSFPPPPDESKRGVLLQQLKWIRGLKGEVVFSDEIKKEYGRWHRRYEKEFSGDPVVDAFVSRYAVMALKLAALEEAMNNGSQIVSPESLAAGCLLIDHTTRALMELAGDEFAVDKRHRVTKKVERFIRERGEVTRSQLLRGLHMQSFDLDRVLKTLVEMEHVERLSKVHEKGGRPSEVLKWTGGQNGA